MIIVSACLAGETCRYDGKSDLKPAVKRLVEAQKAYPVCPEAMGGLKTPRERAEIVGGDGEGVLRGRARVMTASGNDVTQNFITGAEKALDIAKGCGAKMAVLKANSPSCGCGRIYDGTFTRTGRDGYGVFAALLSKNNILPINYVVKYTHSAAPDEAG